MKMTVNNPHGAREIKMTQTQKPIIIIGLILLIIFGGVYGYSARPEIITPPTQDICGDGICSDVERFSKSCKEDCYVEQKDSPFGIFEVTPNDLGYLQDLGVKVVIDSIPPPLWLKESASPNKWTEITQRYKKHIQMGVEVMPVIPLTNDEFNKMSLKEYYESVKQLINYFDKSEWFLLTLEADGIGMGDGVTNKNPEKYALYVRLTYKALKEANPSAKLAAAGGDGIVCSYDSAIEPCPLLIDSSLRDPWRSNYFQKVLNELNYLESVEKNPANYDWKINKHKLSQEEFNLIFAPDAYRNYMEAHQFSSYITKAKEYRKSVLLYKTIKRVLDERGFKEVDLWNTQTGTHSGKPSGMAEITQTEKQQAEIVVKEYVLSLGNGIKKIFWQGVYEWAWPDIGQPLGSPGNPDHFFAKVPLVYDGMGEEAKNNIGPGVKKLAYYTYKKIVEVLDGSDWDNIQTIQGKDGVYVYKFIKNSKPIYVAWNDNPKEKTITLDVGDIKQIKTTQAVPKYNSGKEVTHYNTAFETETKSATNSKVALTLDENPVYIEIATAETEANPFQCPQYAPPAPGWCSDGKIVLRGDDKNGCPRPPQCERFSRETKEDKPFGVYEPCGVNSNRDYQKLYQDLKEAGIQWTDLTVSHSLIGDPLINYVNNSGFSILADIPDGFDLKFGEIPYLPADLAGYSQKLKSYISKYNFIKHWQVREEADIDAFWKDTPENYAIFLRVAYKTIKEANPEAKVVLGKCINCVYDFNRDIPIPDEWFLGKDTLRQGFYLDVLEKLKELEKIEKNPQGDNKYKNNQEISEAEYKLIFKPDSFNEYFDIIAVGRNVLTEGGLKIVKDALKSFGYPDKPIWMIDIGLSGGGFGGYDNGVYVTPEIPELEGSRTLIKTYSQILSLGIERIFYNGGFFDVFTGSKRMEWFTHKLMTEKLKDFTTVEKLADGQYKFSFNDKNPVWVLWSPGFSKTITLDVGNLQQVKITKAVPKYNSGKEVKDYTTVFDVETKSVTNGKITLTLDENPVYVEEE